MTSDELRKFDGKLRHKSWDKNSYMFFDKDKGFWISNSGDRIEPSFINTDLWEIYKGPKPKRKIELVEYVWIEKVVADGQDADAILWLNKEHFHVPQGHWKPTGQTRTIEVEDE